MNDERGGNPAGDVVYLARDAHDPEIEDGLEDAAGPRPPIPECLYANRRI